MARRLYDQRKEQCLQLGLVEQALAATAVHPAPSKPRISGTTSEAAAPAEETFGKSIPSGTGRSAHETVLAAMATAALIYIHRHRYFPKRLMMALRYIVLLA
ncbi:hypothetical protein GCM10011494_01470 [Novosphingobium endophyticum]|uniref:Uncharacterized protein n=1 Tax=Novosphingobium endophyticum TaxID=1955250 RepID=A0A916X2Q2_9SPHN|nr:hypothetical protein GCM10011494_01470 [Novosphingobium endophyticum]